MSDSKQHRGFSFHISDTPPPIGARAKTPLADLELDLGDFGRPNEEALQPMSGKSAPAQGMQESAWLDSRLAVAPMLTPETSPPAAKEQACQAESWAVDAPPSQTIESARSPKIKKIRFPERHSPAKNSAATSSAERTPSPTRFSKSISAAERRIHLDSEPEMARPEDMPGVEQDLTPPSGADIGWTTDTPHAREIWRRARSTWSSASKKAASLGEHGMRASKALAESVSEKLRDASEERKRRIQEHAEHPASPSPGESASSTQSTGPSVASRVILGLARSAAHKAAAPLSAVIAACAVYLAGSYLLGTTGTVALSKAIKSPEIPELGTLHAEGDKGPEVTSDSDAATPRTNDAQKLVSQGPPAMETEVTDMPQGLSWPGKGLIEVVTSAEELVYVDGVFTGRGPLRRIPVSPGEHEISIRADGKERTGKAQVEAGRATRAVFKAE